MDKRTTSIVAYLTWIGLLVAILAGDKKAIHHTNQSLVLFLFSFLSIIPLIGWIWAIIVGVLWIIGFIRALNGSEKPIPILGGIHLLKPPVEEAEATTEE